jgi:hypothetical protein
VEMPLPSDKYWSKSINNNIDLNGDIDIVKKPLPSDKY